MACGICNLFQGKFPIDASASVKDRLGDRNHLCPHFTWRELEASALSGCYGCDILARGCRGCFRHHGIEPESDIAHGEVRFYYPPVVPAAAEEEDGSMEEEGDGDADKTLLFTLKGNESGGQEGHHRGRFDVEMFAVDADDVPKAWDCMPTSVARTSPRTDSAAALATIRGWLADCITHDADICGAPESLPPLLPTRVVDVGLPPEEDGSSRPVQVIRLVETEEGARGRYLCLSHCWGAAQIIRTTRDNIERHKAEAGGIAWGQLSRTFREAVEVTRALGLRYIWIDSLCIVQDDPDDWNREAARMASVYSNGHLTLAATHAADGEGGLFAATPDVEVGGKTPPETGADDYVVFFREKIDHHLELADDENEAGAAWTHDWKPTRVRFPLLTRAWVYQERMLSPRVVHFGHHELFFECRAAVECECGGIRHHGSSGAAASVLMKVEHGVVGNSARSTIPSAEFDDSLRYRRAQVWRSMVCAYTALSLTVAGDRLPAIGGLAKDMAGSRGSARYWAGVWEDAANDDLLWTVWATAARRRAPAPRNAPTWSWASVGNNVSYGDAILYSNLDEEEDLFEERLPHEHFARIEACRVTSSTVDEFGTVARGELTVTGLVARGELGHEMQVHKGRQATMYHVSFAGARFPFHADHVLGTGPQLEGEVMCIRMSRLAEGQRDKLVSLVLIKTPGRDDIFERIGIMFIQTTRPAPEGFDLSGPYRTAELKTVTIV